MGKGHSYHPAPKIEEIKGLGGELKKVRKSPQTRWRRIGGKMSKNLRVGLTAR